MRQASESQLPVTATTEHRSGFSQIGYEPGQVNSWQPAFKKRGI